MIENYKEENENCEENEKWECYLCTKENNFSIFPDGYLANYHPLCGKCTDEILSDKSSNNRFRLSYHKSIGDLMMISNIPVQQSFTN